MPKILTVVNKILTPFCHQQGTCSFRCLAIVVFYVLHLDIVCKNICVLLCLCVLYLAFLL
ncbi:unnamed protein product [Prunus brigantina]